MGKIARFIPPTISAVQIRKSLAEGDVAYCVVIIEGSKGSIDIQGIPIVENFPEVFIDDLLGIPPYREIEFTIEL